MHIHLVRHAQTEANVQRLASCSADEPLNKQGLEQAKLLAAALSTFTFSDIWCSPLKRAYQTLAPYLQKTDAVADYLPLLCEGRFNLDPQAPITEPVFDPDTGLPAEEENIGSFRGRVSALLKKMKGQSEHSSLLILTHGHFIRETLNLLLGATTYARFPVANCSLTHIELNQFTVVHSVNRPLM